MTKSISRTLGAAALLCLVILITILATRTVTLNTLSEANDAAVNTAVAATLTASDTARFSTAANPA